VAERAGGGVLWEGQFDLYILADLQNHSEVGQSAFQDGKQHHLQVMQRQDFPRDTVEGVSKLDGRLNSQLFSKSKNLSFCERLDLSKECIF
jgi:hypothetical protein